MHPKLRTLKVQVWPDQSDALQLAQHLRRDLARVEKQIREADGNRPRERRDMARRLSELEHAAFELAGLGVAHSDGRTRRMTPRRAAAAVAVVQKAAEAFAASSPGLAENLPNPALHPAPAYPGAYPATLISLVHAQVDAFLKIAPSLVRALGSRHEDFVKGLVLATAVHARALANGKKRSDYLNFVLHALQCAGLVGRANVATLKKQVGRYL